jgi:arylsulfatase
MRLTALLVLAAASSAWAADRPPNIVFVLADDLGRAELGCYGQKKIRTPEIDRLAAEGMRFTRFYAGSPVGAPSRCVLLTGRHNGRAAVRDNREAKPEGQFPLPAAEVTVAERLKARGYATACIGKSGLGMVGTEGDPNAQGFDLFYGYNCQRHAHNHYPTYIRRNAERIPWRATPAERPANSTPTT